ncbi:hypothetical protein Tco_0317120 [Tanacetum coccineum]
MKEVIQQQIFEDNSYQAHEDHKNLFKALKKSLERDYSNQLLSDLQEDRRKKRKKRASSRTPSGSPPTQPPPSPPPTGASGAPDSLMNDDSIPDEQVQLSDDEDIENDHLPNTDMRKDWWKPLPEGERPTNLEPAWTIPSSNISNIRDMMTFMNWYCRKVNKTVLTQADFEGQAYEINWANPEGDQVRINVSRSLPLGGPPGPHCSFSRWKAARYTDLDFETTCARAEMWVLMRHDSPSRRKEVRNHMGILSVVRIKAYSRYGYDYLSEIVLWRADFQEFKIAEKDFKNMYPSDFEDLNLLLLQGHLDHLSGSDKRMLSTAVRLWTRNLVIQQRVEDFQLGIESYQTQLNLTKPTWDAKKYEFEHDYTIIESPRAVVFPANNNERKITRFNKIYKFSDGTLTRILEALDYRVKEFKIKRLNLGMNTRFWTQKDVTRSKEFMSAIERRLKTRRIYRNLECFVGGRVHDIDYKLLQITE